MLVAGSALLGAVASPASAVPSAEYLGVNMQPLMKDPAIPEARWDSFMRPLADGQMRVHRVDINWRLAEPSKPAGGQRTYVWNNGPGTRTSIDFLVTSMVRNGLRPQPVFTAAPTWAFQQGGEAWFADYTAFVTAFAQRYGPGGAFWAENPGLPELPPLDFEIWNEANSPNFWTGRADAPAYARLLKVLYPQLKAAAPWARLHVSIGWPEASDYLRELAQQGAGGLFDGVAFHPYAPTAPAILRLVTSMRGALAAVGRGTAPIIVNETGQPAVYSGTGAQHAYAGKVADATRAATQSIAADILARADCGVEQFSVYAITGSETSREIIDEGYMGVLRYADGSPNATGRALQRASLRWVTAVQSGNPLPAGPLRLCSEPATAQAALLPLELSITAAGSSCVRGSVGYDGNPLEESTLVLERPDGRSHRTSPDAFGSSEVCIPDGPPVSTVDVHAEVPKAARSATYRCDVPITPNGCVLVQPPPGVAAQAAGAAPICTVRVTALRPIRARRGRQSSTKVRATLLCPQYRTYKNLKKRVRVKTRVVNGKTVALPRKRWRWKTVTVRRTVQPRFIVGYKVNPPKSWKGKKRQRALREVRLRRVTLRHNSRVSFTVRRQIRAGDQVILTHKVNPKADALPRVKVSVALKAPRKPKSR